MNIYPILKVIVLWLVVAAVLAFGAAWFFRWLHTRDTDTDAELPPLRIVNGDPRPLHEQISEANRAHHDRYWGGPFPWERGA